MIKNQIIIDKIKVKTRNDSEMQNFLLELLNRESEGKQFRKFYANEIKKITRRKSYSQKGG